MSKTDQALCPWAYYLGGEREVKQRITQVNIIGNCEEHYKHRCWKSLRPSVAWGRGGSSEKVIHLATSCGQRKWPDDWELARQVGVYKSLWVEAADSREAPGGMDQACSGNWNEASVAEHSEDGLGRWHGVFLKGALPDHVELWILHFILKTVGSNERFLIREYHNQVDGLRCSCFRLYRERYRKRSKEEAGDNWEVIVGVQVRMIQA